MFDEDYIPSGYSADKCSCAFSFCHFDVLYPEPDIGSEALQGPFKDMKLPSHKSIV